jgi:hypothetical protein
VTAAAPPPGFGELLAGPFLGVAVYPRAAAVRPLRVFLAAATVALGAALLLAGRWEFVLSARVAALRDSQLWMMPRVTVQGGEAQIEGSPGRVLETPRLVVVLDPTEDLLDPLPGAPEDVRSVVHVARRGLLVYRRPLGGVMALPWSSVEASFGPLSLNGEELLDWLPGVLRTVLAVSAGLALLMFLVWELALCLLLVGLYRTIFFRGLYLPGFGALLSVAFLAALPATAVGAAGALAGLPHSMLLGLHALALGTVFFVGATRVRLGDERPSAP